MWSVASSRGSICCCCAHRLTPPPPPPPPQRQDSSRDFQPKLIFHPPPRLAHHPQGTKRRALHPCWDQTLLFFRDDGISMLPSLSRRLQKRIPPSDKRRALAPSTALITSVRLRELPNLLSLRCARRAQVRYASYVIRKLSKRSQTGWQTGVLLIKCNKAPHEIV